MPGASARMNRELARLSCDCSFLLTHLIRQNAGRTDLESKRVLKQILDIEAPFPRPVLRATPVGWYARASGANIYNPASDSFEASVNANAVCFTESTLAGLKAHREVFKAHYGLAFDRELLFQKGANPCLNIRDSIWRSNVQFDGERFKRSLFNIIQPVLHPYINIISESFDATHEREWRYPGDLRFRISEVWFIFCRETDFSDFSQVQRSGRPVLVDLDWLDRI